jgi:hypothetical protein
MMSIFLKTNSNGVPSPLLLSWLTFIILISGFSLIFQPYFPLQHFMMGHDYSVGLTSLLDGNIWFKNNGLEPPWFSPSFCAGQPFFGDPQSSYYSILQILSIFFGLINAAYITLLIAATLLFWGGYLLMRHVFKSGYLVAVLVGGLLMYNGFLPHRMLVGHSTFHSFALLPWISVLLLIPVRNVLNSIAAAIAAGVLMAYCVHAGLGTIILAVGLAILLIALLHGLRGGSLKIFWSRSALAIIVGLGLSISKLWASFSFLSNFPRTFYLLPGAANFTDTVGVIVGGLFLPSQWAYHFGAPRLVNVQWAIAPHEWAYNFSIGAALFLIFILLKKISNLKQFSLNKISLRQGTLLFFIFLGAIWPFAFNLFEPNWNAFLKTIPIINATSTPLRWIIVYIPLLAVVIGLSFQQVKWGRFGGLIVGAILVSTVAQSALEPREYYLSQGYKVAAVVYGDELFRNKQWQPSIQNLDIQSELQVGLSKVKLTGNDTFINGVSQVFCYNPVFGYRHEKFSSDGLVAGSVFLEQNGFLNLKNPACYLYPKENSCVPGDRFRADQKDQVQNFVNYRPFDFNISAGQRYSNLLTKLSLILVSLFFLGWVIFIVRQKLISKWRPTCQ